MSSGKRGKGWTETEMSLLCQSWLAVSEDASIGTGQKAETFWSRVLKQLNTFLQEKDLSSVDKDWNKVQAKFGVISKDVSLFGACYKIVMDLDESGKSDADRLVDAHALFLKRSNQEQTKRYAFKYLSCYNVLKNAPKWGQHAVKVQSTPTKKRKLASVSTSSPVERCEAEALADNDESPLFGAKPKADKGSLLSLGVRRAKIEKEKLHLQARAVQASEEVAKSLKHSGDKKVEALQAIATNKTISLLLKTNPSSELARQLLDNMAKKLLKQQQLLDEADEQHQQASPVAGTGENVNSSDISDE